MEFKGGVVGHRKFMYSLCFICNFVAQKSIAFQHTMTTMMQQQQQEDAILRDVKEEKRTFLKQSSEASSHNFSSDIFVCLKGIAVKQIKSLIRKRFHDLP